MINHTPAELSHKLWEHDPMGTCCNVNEGMEDEYDAIAATILQYAQEMPDEEAVKQAIIYWFDEYFYNKKKDQLHKCIF